jgi:DNA helicase-2/ATP-dependent DNA helicase PcrA
VLARRILLENLTESLLRDYERFQNGTVVCRDMLEREFSVQTDGVRLTGRIDRIDRTPGGDYVILDYKTGMVPDKKDHMPENDYMEVQLGFYGLLFRKNFPDRRMGGLGYYDLGRTHDIELVVEGDETDEYVDRFEAHLRGFIETFENKKTLSLASDMAYCRYCPYDAVCRVYEI